MNIHHDHSCFHHHIPQVPLLSHRHTKSNMSRLFSAGPIHCKHMPVHTSYTHLLIRQEHLNNSHTHCQDNMTDSSANYTGNTGCQSTKWQVMKCYKMCRWVNQCMWCSMKDMVDRDVKCWQSKQSHKWLR